MFRRFVLVVCFIFAEILPVMAQNGTPSMPFDSWLQQFAEEAVASGISPATVQRAMTQIALDDSVIELDQKQPETTITFEKYVHNTLSDSRIAKGQRLLEEHRAQLQDVTARYGVSESIIVALWGIESSFGSNGGDYDVLSSLGSLAYEGRRAELFRRELLAALKILDDEHMDPTFLRGSWAGAMGQCQFMPSTYLRFAVDYDGDGRRNIWEREGDVFASIANYLIAEGWQPGLAWGREVNLTRPLPETEIGLGHQQTLAEWNRLGVRTMGGNPLPNKDLSASLIEPDGPDGRSFLVYDNFRVLMRWNRSTYFATSVGLLADRIASQ
ncbi:MAG: lytic murein transglycosylase [Alphaproteobacteria bacterium]|nr:lytic murein transglycosylase [Alphaproteobacteria bacterium]